jgi:iron complex outermembrane receptor protein
MYKTSCLITIYCCSFYAFSQDEIDIFSLSLGELTQINIATTQKQTIYSSPSSVYVITRQQIKNMGIQNLQTLLNFVPGFQSTRDVEQGTANRISARGRSTALSESVLVQIDGKKINDLYTGGISILNRLLDIGHVEHIEIIRGPGSALYGSNAFLGVINIVTVSHHNEVNLAGTKPGKVSSNISYSHQFSQTNAVDFYLSMFNDNGENYYLTDINGISDKVSDPAEGIDIYLKHSFDNWLFTGRYMKRELEDFLSLGSIGNNINREESQQWSFSAEYSGILSDKLSYNFLLSHSQDKWKTLAVLIPKDVDIFPGFSLTNNFIGGPFLKSQNNNVSLNFTYQANNDHLLSFGSSYEKAKISDVYTATTHDLFTLDEYEASIKLTGDESFNDNKSRKVTSLYIQDQFHITEDWELTAGVRYDAYSDFGSSTNPRLALVWKQQEKSSIKLMYGSAFRAPNFLELYDRNNYVDFGNINLNAEEVETTELSWLNTYRNWHFEITAFSNIYKELIILNDPVEHPENPFFAPSFTNNNGQKSRGIESELLYKFNNQLSLKVLWNLFSNDSDINTSKNTGALVIDYHKEKLHINFHGFYRGKNPAVKNQSSYFVASANITHQMSTQLKLKLSVSNIFDEHYKTQSIIYDEGVENRGRAVTFGVEYQF